MNCCKCNVETIKNCICAIQNCECNINNLADCWCCVEDMWLKLVDNNNSFKYLTNILEEAIKNKKIEKIVREEFSQLKKDIFSNKKQKSKTINKSYLDLIETNIDPVLVVQSFHANLITKIIYFVNELNYYLEIINLVVEVFPSFNISIDYEKIDQYINSVDKILPFIVNEFKSIKKEIDNSFEYEMLKAKLFDLDELVIRIKDKIEVKTIYNNK
ncbi:hypothetical protein SLITO_v1c03190 [Spiroplasma litorale]|uniref:Uncharacterized protein n=1 Tax=Spiroplasma litorale TaxID=216942 RepID=A0A0K1W0X5_9MOLU|nr:hypothetical protein [Spiroplasma litorale]AKX33974.1 hypothetical protein SLITO_v1c03190 [Spiroplasma litorale]